VEAEAHQAGLGGIGSFRSSICGWERVRHFWQRHSHTLLVSYWSAGGCYIYSADRSYHQFGIAIIDEGFVFDISEKMTTMPNKSPEPTAVGAVRSAVAVHVASRRWLSFFR
jgi:hypothetical protein